MSVSKLTCILDIKLTCHFVDKMIDKKHCQQKTLSINNFVIYLTR